MIHLQIEYDCLMGERNTVLVGLFYYDFDRFYPFVS